MKRTRSIVLPVLVLLSLAAVLLSFWYTRPRTAEQYFPGFQWSQIDQVQARYTCYVPRSGAAGSLSVREVSGQTPAFAAGQAEFDALLALLQELTFSPDPAALLPFRSGQIRVKGGDQDSAVVCRRDETGDAFTLWIQPSRLKVWYEGDLYQCTLVGQEEALAALADFFQAHGAPSPDVEKDPET